MNTIMKTYRPVVNSYPSMLDGLFNDSALLRNDRKLNLPAVNVLETELGFKLELAIPGLKKEQIKVQVDNQTLTISGDQNEADSKNYIKKEFSFESFSRSFQLPKSVDLEKIDAHFENGVLNLTLPKKEEALPKEPRAIEIA